MKSFCFIFILLSFLSNFRICSQVLAQATPNEQESKKEAVHEGEHVLRLVNGDTFPAEWKAFMPKKKSLSGGGFSRIRVASDLLMDEMDLDIRSLDEMQVSTMSAAPVGYSLVQMSNGDSVWGNINKINPDSIEVETLWAGKIQIKRNMIASIAVRNPATFFYEGTRDFTGWTKIGGENMPDTWKVKNGCFVSNQREDRAIRRVLELPDKVKVRFRIHYTGYGRSSLVLWGSGEEKESTSVRHGLSLDVQGSYCQLYLSSPRGRKPIGTARLNIDSQESEAQIMDVVLYADKKNHFYFLYVNGVRAGAWSALAFVMGEGESDEESEGLGTVIKDWKPGNIVQLGMSQVPVTISALSFSRWSGAEPSVQLEGVKLSEAQEAAKKEIAAKEEAAKQVAEPAVDLKKTDVKKGEVSSIQLVNGDVVSGKILEVNSTNIRVEAGKHTINIPINRALGLNLTDQPNVKISVQRLYTHDVRLNLADFSTATVDLRGFENGLLRAYSESLGEVKIPLKWVREVLFNVHKPELIKMRAGLIAPQP